LHADYLKNLYLKKYDIVCKKKGRKEGKKRRKGQFEQSLDEGLPSLKITKMITLPLYFYFGQNWHT
jgi:hypothetical protein